MIRVQMQFTQEQLEALRAQAAASGRPLAAVVRDAVDAWMADHQRSRLVDRALGAIGGFHSGLGDLADHHDRYIDDTIPA